MWEIKDSNKLTEKSVGGECVEGEGDETTSPSMSKRITWSVSAAWIVRRQRVVSVGLFPRSEQRRLGSSTRSGQKLKRARVTGLLVRIDPNHFFLVYEIWFAPVKNVLTIGLHFVRIFRYVEVPRRLDLLFLHPIYTYLISLPSDRRQPRVSALSPFSKRGPNESMWALTILNFSSFFATLKPRWLRLFITRFLKQCIKIRYSYSCTWNAFYFIDTRLELTIEFEESLYWKLNINLRIKHDTISVKN